MSIHASAIVDKLAEISESAEIGPFAVIEGHVRIGKNVRVYPNAYVSGWTDIGDNCEIHPGAVVGHLPQDFHFSGERSFCRIGAGTIIREFASIHRGTQPESCTTVGRDCFLLGYSHIGHNCDVGDEVKIYNCAALSGHVTIGDHAIISGYVLVHQFARIGRYAMIGGGCRVTKDVPPYMKALYEAECVGYNSLGLRRSEEFSPHELNEVKEAYRMLFRSGSIFRDAVEGFSKRAKTRTGRDILAFVRGESKLGIAGGRRTNRFPASKSDTGSE